MIRLAHASDVLALHDIEAACFGPDAWSVSRLTADMAAPTRISIIADDGTGYAMISVVAGSADLERIAVKPETRRSGLATALLNAALAAAIDRAATAMLLEVAEDNEAARALYAALGFTLLTRRRDYYGTGRDALVLRQDLETS